jgi:hypothetical protein
MPQEPPAGAGPSDPIAAFETARDAFGWALRDLHIRCGKPRQSALVAAAREAAVARNNEAFRLHAGTLSEVLSGKKLPTHPFLSALIRQLADSRPAVGEYKALWPQWDSRWQELMRLQVLATRHREQLRAEAAQSAAAVDRQIREQADDLLARARQEANDLLAAAHTQAASLMQASREECAQRKAASQREIAAEGAAAARRAVDDATKAGQRLQQELAHEAERHHRQAQAAASLMITRAEQTSELLHTEAQYTADEILADARDQAEWERRDVLLRTIIEAEDLRAAEEQQADLHRAQAAHRRRALLDEAEDNARTIVEQARNKAEQVRRAAGELLRQREDEALQFLEQARSEADAVRAKAQQEVDQARLDAYWEAHHEARKLTAEAEAEAEYCAQITLEAEQQMDNWQTQRDREERDLRERTQDLQRREAELTALQERSRRYPSIEDELHRRFTALKAAQGDLDARLRALQLQEEDFKRRDAELQKERAALRKDIERLRNAVQPSNVLYSQTCRRCRRLVAVERSGWRSGVWTCPCGESNRITL